MLDHTTQQHGFTAITRGQELGKLDEGLVCFLEAEKIVENLRNIPADLRDRFWVLKVNAKKPQHRCGKLVIPAGEEASLLNKWEVGAFIQEFTPAQTATSM